MPVSTSAPARSCVRPHRRRWRGGSVEQRGDRYFVAGKLEPETPAAIGRSRKRRHRRHGCRGHQRRRHAPCRGLRRPHRDDQPRDRPALRQAESLEGLPGRSRSRGMAAGASARVLRRAAHRAAARRRGLVDRHEPRSTSPSNRTSACRSTRSYSPPERNRGCCRCRTRESTTCARGAMRNVSSSSRQRPGAPS